MRRGPRVTITFQPDQDVLTLLNKVVAKHAIKGASNHGLRSRTINSALREHLPMELADQKRKAA
jgi:hypothetical protein